MLFPSPTAPCFHLVLRRSSWFRAACTLAAMLLWLPTAVAGQPLLFEHFERTTQGKARAIEFTSDVVGYGGVTWPNGHAAVFNKGRHSSVDYGTARKIAADDFTIEAFLKPAATMEPIAAIAADWNDEGDNRAWALVLLENGSLRFDVSPDGKFNAANTLLTGRRFIQPGKWHHVAAVCKGDRSMLYVNGRLVAQGKRSAPGVNSTDQANLKIGNVDVFAGSPRPFSGFIDEVRVTERALSPQRFLQTHEPMPKALGPVPEKYLMPFVARSKSEAIVWQKRARARLFELVEAQEPRVSLEEAPLSVEVAAPEDRGDYTLFRGSFRGNGPEDCRYPFFLTVPKGTGPFPAMLCLHGHGGRREAVFDPNTPYHAFADRFARGGYVVLAPSFPHKRFAAMMLWDLLRCVDVLTSRDEVDPERIGVAGLSMGGEWTMWAAACDTRLRAAVVSGWLCTTEGVFSVPNCPCWELPGLVDLTDVCEVHLLIAPRPAIFESAARDECFPIRYTREAFQRVRRGYAVFEAEEAVDQDVWDARHEWHGSLAWPWVDRILGGHAAKPGR